MPPRMPHITRVRHARFRDFPRSDMRESINRCVARGSSLVLSQLSVAPFTWSELALAFHPRLHNLSFVLDCYSPIVENVGCRQWRWLWVTCKLARWWGLASLASSDEDDADLNVDDRDGPVPKVGRFHRTPALGLIHICSLFMYMYL